MVLQGTVLVLKGIIHTLRAQYHSSFLISLVQYLLRIELLALEEVKKLVVLEFDQKRIDALTCVSNLSEFGRFQGISGFSS